MTTRDYMGRTLVRFRAMGANWEVLWYRSVVSWRLSWRPRRLTYWSGKITVWKWAWIGLQRDQRTDILGDWIGR